MFTQSEAVPLGCRVASSFWEVAREYLTADRKNSYDDHPNLDPFLLPP